MQYDEIATELQELIDLLPINSRPRLNSYLQALENYAPIQGFTQTQLDEIWRKTLQLPLQHAEFMCVVHWMVPSRNVLPETLDFLMAWVKVSAKKSGPASIILQWVIAGVYAKVIEKKDLQNSYYLLLNMLTTTKFTHEICQLLYMLTDPYLITPYTVSRVLSLRRIYADNDPYAALLSLYKRLKPHLIEDDTIRGLINDNQMFPGITRKLLLCFRIAGRMHDRKPNKGLCRYPKWRMQTIAFKRRSRENIVYVSELTMAETICECKKSKIEFNGTMYEPFLENPYGFIYLALVERRLHRAMHKYFAAELFEKSKLLRRRESDEFRAFLAGLASLQNSYGQSIVEVDEFLKDHFEQWNGTAYENEIFSLLQNIVLSDYDVIFERILKPLYELNAAFVDPLFARKTIKALAWCLYNNMNYLQQPPIFQQNRQQHATKSNLKQFQKSFIHLCHLFVNTFQNNAAILHEIADSHILLSSIAQEDNDDPIGLLPFRIAHRILINSDVILLNKFARILATLIGRTNKPLHNDVQAQFDDFFDVLFRNILRSTMFETKAFEWIDRDIARMPELKRIFRSRNNLSFISLARIDNGEYMPEFDKGIFQANCNEVCEHFDALFTLGRSRP